MHTLHACAWWYIHTMCTIALVQGYYYTSTAWANNTTWINVY